MIFPVTLHSKNTRVKLDSEKGPLGPNSIVDPEISQLDSEYDPELGQSDPFICQVCRKLTTFRVTVDPERSLTQIDPFPGHADSDVLRVYGLSELVHYTNVSSNHSQKFEIH